MSLGEAPKSIVNWYPSLLENFNVTQEELLDTKNHLQNNYLLHLKEQIQLTAERKPSNPMKIFDFSENVESQPKSNHDAVTFLPRPNSFGFDNVNQIQPRSNGNSAEKFSSFESSDSGASDLLTPTPDFFNSIGDLSLNPSNQNCEVPKPFGSLMAYRCNSNTSQDTGYETDMSSHAADDSDFAVEADSPQQNSPVFYYRSSNINSPQEQDSPSDRHSNLTFQRSRDLNSAKLWEWILHLLLNPNKYKHLISWEDRTTGLFKIHNARELTKFYNDYKNTVPSRNRARSQATGIKYESILRALRHCYKTKVMTRVNKKHKYEFGPNAVNWKLGLSRERAVDSIERWENSSKLRQVVPTVTL